ncbi:pseudouridine synthase [Roseburia hominis]
MMRLDKYLADMGLGTRSELKKAIRGGRVIVGETPAVRPEMKIDETHDTVRFDGKEITYRRLEYWMLHKPAGVLSATKDPKQPTVLDLLGPNRRKDLFPVGRLDKDTEGLLLITNDGEMAHRLLSPAKHVNKTYYARIDQEVGEAAIEAFRAGIDIGDDTLTMPAELMVLDRQALSESPFNLPLGSVKGNTFCDPLLIARENTRNNPQAASCREVLVTIQEGRYHQIKRMFEALGMQVLYLKRLSMGNLVLDAHLEKGQARLLTEEELDRLC